MLFKTVKYSCLTPKKYYLYPCSDHIYIAYYTNFMIIITMHHHRQMLKCITPEVVYKASAHVCIGPLFFFTLRVYIHLLFLINLFTLTFVSLRLIKLCLVFVRVVIYLVLMFYLLSLSFFHIHFVFRESNKFKVICNKL